MSKLTTKPREPIEPRRSPLGNFGNRLHKLTRDDNLKSIETRRRKSREKLEAAERLEQQAKQLAADPAIAAAYPTNTLNVARRLVELEQLCLAKQKATAAASTPEPTGTPARRRLLPGESPQQGIKRLWPALYRDLLSQVQWDESKVMGLLERQGRQLF